MQVLMNVYWENSRSEQADEENTWYFWAESNRDTRFLFVQFTAWAVRTYMYIMWITWNYFLGIYVFYICSAVEAVSPWDVRIVLLI
jgi:hypothetical protein